MFSFNFSKFVYMPFAVAEIIELNVKGVAYFLEFCVLIADWVKTCLSAVCLYMSVTADT